MAVERELRAASLQDRTKGGAIVTSAFCFSGQQNSSKICLFHHHPLYATLTLTPAGDDSHLHQVPAGSLQSPSGPWRAEKSHDRFNIREKRRVQQWSVISSGESSVAKEYEPYTFRPGSNRIVNLLSNRIGAHRYLPRRHYGKLNILGQYIRRASWTFYGILYILNIGPTARRRKIHQCQGYDVGRRILLHLWGLSGSETHTHNHEMMD